MRADDQAPTFIHNIIVLVRLILAAFALLWTQVFYPPKSYVVCGKKDSLLTNLLEILGEESFFCE